MAAPDFAFFDTALGGFGVVWGARGLIGMQLPEGDERELVTRILRRWPDAREAPLSSDAVLACDAIIAYLRGEPSDFSTIALDMEGAPPFHRRVYEAARAIPRGVTLSYGEIAKRLGAPGAARAVGQALGRNPFAIIVPCHRVLAADGSVGGFSAHGGVATKLRLLALEGVDVNALSRDGSSSRKSSRSDREAL